MNIFHKLALKGLKENRARTMVTVVGVILSTAMMTAVAAFGTSLLQFMINGSIEKCGGWHAAFLEADSAFIQERASDREAADTAFFENIGYAALDGVKSPEKPYLFIAGFDKHSYDALPISLISGRLPENSHELLIPSHVAIKGGVRLRVGDTLTLPVGSRLSGDKTLGQHDPFRPGEETLVPAGEKAYTVVGTYERPGFEEHLAPGYTAVTAADPADQPDGYSLFVTLKKPRNVKAYADSLSGAGTYVLNEDVLRFMGVTDNKLFNTLLYSVGGVLTAIIMAGSIFMIYNSFHISTNERIRQFGILMSVGATQKQLKTSVLFEGLCIGAVGIPPGILAGIGCTALILPVVAGKFSTMINSSIPLTLSVSLPSLAGAAAVSLTSVLISAYLPARKAAAAPVMECILQTNEIKTEAKTIKTPKFIQRICGLEGTLAFKNFRRNKKRYRSVVLSLTLSVVLFVTGNAFGTTLKQIAEASAVEMDGDILFYTPDIEEKELFELYEKLKTADGVYKSTYQADLSWPCVTDDLPADFLSDFRRAAGEDSAGKSQTLPLNIQFIEDGLYIDFIKSLGLSPQEYTGQDAAILIAGINTNEHTTYFTNATMDFTLTSASGEQEKTIRATFADSYPLDLLPLEQPETPYLFIAVAPWQMKPQLDALGIPAQFGLTVWSDNPAQSMAEIQSLIEESEAAPDYSLINLSSTVDLFRSAIFVVDVFTYIFVIMLSLIAAANVFNTISTNIRLRRRELAMLRSVGMPERSFQKMLNIECAFYGIRTLFFGVPIAGALSWLVYKGLMGAERLDGIGFVFPWSSMTVGIAGVFCIVFITMLYAAGRVKKENIIEALRDEMT